MAEYTPTIEEVRGAYARSAATQEEFDWRCEVFDAWLDDHDQAHAVATLCDAVVHLQWFASVMGPGEPHPAVVAAWKELQLMAMRIEGNREAARG